MPKIEPASKLDVILPRSPFDLQTEAVLFYVRCHLQKLEDVPTLLNGASDDLLLKWTSPTHSHTLDIAISCIAMAVFSRTHHYPPAAVEASIKYQQLLQLLQVALPSLDRDNLEASLLTILFMGLYEDSIHRPQLNTKKPFVKTLQSFRHRDGVLAILKFWKEHLSLTQPATNVIKHVRRVAIKWALIGNVALPEWMKEGASFGEHGLELEYDGIIARIACARQTLYTLLKHISGPQQTSTELTSTAETLNKEARDIDRALQNWTTHFPSTWYYRRHTLSNAHFWPKKYFYSPIVYSHQSCAYAAVWIRYHFARMLINSTRLSVLQLSEANSGSFSAEGRLECLSHITSSTDDLASTLPFCLERFKITDIPGSSDQTIILNTNEDIKPYLAGLILSPLAIAASIKHVDVEHKLWFKSQLVQLGRVMGYGIFESAMTDHWLEF